MTTIADILKALTPNARDRLLYAFQSGLTHYVSIGDSRFIGVNVTGIPHLQIEISDGDWAYGSIVTTSKVANENNWIRTP